MEAGYSVGTRTIVDVLDATTTLYNAKQQLSSARYQYLINQLNIKQALGTLNEQDLLALNNALGKPVSTSPDSVAPENRSRLLRLILLTLTAARLLHSQPLRVPAPAAIRSVTKSVIRPTAADALTPALSTGRGASESHPNVSQRKRSP